MSFPGGLGGDLLRRMTQGQFDDMTDDDHQNVGQMVRNAPPEAFQQSAANSLRNTNPQMYSDHVTPGIGGTNPLGGMGGQLLQSVAMMLLQRMMQGRGGGDGGFPMPGGQGQGGGFQLPGSGGGGGFPMPGGGGGGGGFGQQSSGGGGGFGLPGMGGGGGGGLGGLDIGDLLRSIGIGTTDPQRMTETDVARLASYVQQNDPDALANTAAQFQGQPDVVRGLLGDAAYGGAASSLASSLGGQASGATDDADDNPMPPSRGRTFTA